MADGTRSTLGLTQLARTWARRLQQSDPVAERDTLVVMEGPPEIVGCRFPLDRRAGRIPITRGDGGQPRAAGQPIALPSAYVSDPHAVLEAAPAGWRIVDQDSSNHTYVGTVRVTEQLLVYGDEIRVGDVVLLHVCSERDALPPHAVDRPSGLLSRRVLVAEASLVAGRGRAGLLLLHVPGLRDAAADAVSDLGQRMLRRWGDLLLGRLEAELFIAVWLDADGETLRREGEALRRELVPLLAPRGLDCRCVTLVADDRSTGFPQLLACARAALQGAPGDTPLVEAELGPPLLADGALLDAVTALPDLPLLLLAIRDEDHLRHHLGHDRLAARRWQLRRAVQRCASERGLPMAGVLDQRLFVLGLRESEQAETLRDAIGLLFREQDLLCISPGPGRPGDPAALRRWLLQRADRTDVVGPRERVDALPTPVAAPYSLIWVVASHTARLKTILDCTEVVTRFLAGVTLAAVAARPELSDVAAAALRERRQRPLPLGQWVALLRQLAPHLPASDPLCDVIRRALGVDRRGVRVAHLIERQLLPERNRFAHAELAPDEQRSAETAARLLEPLGELMRHLEPLGELQLFTLLRSDPRRSGGARAALRVHTGPREHFEVRQVDVRRPGPLFPGSAYLATLDYRHLLELSPLVHLQLCPRCDREELFLADRLVPAGHTMELSAVSTGHRLRWTLSDDDLPEGLAALLAPT